eukprot:gene11135-3954_t
MRIFLFFVFVCFVASRDWWVSQNRGDDTNTGIRDDPFATFQKGISSLQDGDRLFIEIGIYNFNKMTIKKSISIIGLPSKGSTPLLSGSFFITSNSFSFESINLESRNGNTLEFMGNDIINLKKIQFGLSKGDVIKITNVKKEVKMSKLNVDITGGITINSEKPTNLIILDQVVLSNTVTGIKIKNSNKLVIVDTSVSNIKYCRKKNSCGISIDTIKEFQIFQSSVTDSQNGFIIQRANGTLLNIKSQRNLKGDVTYGSGLYVSENSHVKATGIDLIGNRAFVGGGFYCGIGKLEIYSGRIHENTANFGGPGQCNIAHCTFKMEGVEIENNNPNTSNCPGFNLINHST